MKTVTKTEATKMLEQKKLKSEYFESGYTMLMPKAKAEKWLKALRSGGYVQTEATLHDSDTGSFCCLGVEQHCNNKGYVEVDSYGDWKSLPTFEYLEEQGYLYVNAQNSRVNGPYDSNENKDIADINDEVNYNVVVKVNQHKSVLKHIHKHNFKEMANSLEKLILVY